VGPWQAHCHGLIVVGIGESKGNLAFQLFFWEVWSKWFGTGTDCGIFLLFRALERTGIPFETFLQFMAFETGGGRRGDAGLHGYW
jgi:hypothetical protein